MCTCTHAHRHNCSNTSAHVHMHTCTHAHAHACTYAHAHDHACTHAHAHLQQFCSVQCSCTSYSQILQCRTMAIPLDQQGLSGFAMPDPYGLQDYCQSLLPDAPSTDDIIEALELWKFPQEAYPKDRKRYPKPVCSWIVETPCDLIQVHLRRQVFVSRPSPCWPGNDVYQLDPAFGKSYFSFFTSWQFEIGPVVNPMPPGKRDTGHRGFNHVNAELAWGEAKILSGMASKDFVLQWSANFKLEMVSVGRSCPYPPVLKEFVWHCWPEIASQLDNWDTWDTNWASLDAEQPDPESAPLETIQDHAAQEFEEDNYDAEQADQEQLPELEEIYESDWSPASIPDFVDICNDQHQSAHDEMCAESWECVHGQPHKMDPMIEVASARHSQSCDEDADDEDSSPASSHGSHSDQEFMGPNPTFTCVFWKS